MKKKTTLYMNLINFKYIQRKRYYDVRYNQIRHTHVFILLHTLPCLAVLYMCAIEQQQQLNEREKERNKTFLYNIIS